MDSTDYEGDENGDFKDHENEDTRDVTQGSSSSDIDSDEERRRYFSYIFGSEIQSRILLLSSHQMIYSDIRYDEKMEEFLDQAYERFVARKEGSTRQRKRTKQAYAEDSQLLEVWSCHKLSRYS